MSKIVECVVKERTQSAKDKIELRNITFTTGMDSHRRTSCAVQPGNPTTNSATEKAGMNRKRSTGQKPCNSGLEKFDQTIQSFKDTDTAKKYYKRKTKMLSSAAVVMGILAVALALLDIELTIRGRDTAQDLSTMNLSVILDNPFRLSAVVVKSSLSVLSLLTSITIYRMNVNELRYLVVRNIYLRSENFVMTSLFPSCLAEVAICLFHVPPFLDHYAMPHELQLLVFLRLYLIAKYVKEHNMFVDNQATAVFASVTQTEISSVFLVKAYFLKFPFRLIFTFYLLNIFLGGYFVYVIERNHSTYLDTVWMLVVTMTTLGFGDVVPKKLLARAFVGFASVLGIFLMALFISVVHEALQLKQQEKRILATMENAEHLSRKKNLAATCIQSTWKLYRFKKENADTIEWGDWFKTQKFRRYQHKMAEDIRKWRFVRRSWSRDDYWRKFFLADDIAMLLTDVSRSVGNVELFLQKQAGVRRISKSSFKRSNGSVESPPPILESCGDCVKENTDGGHAECLARRQEEYQRTLCDLWVMYGRVMETAQENQRTQDLELLKQIMNSRLKSLAKLNSDFDYEGTTEESSITQNSQLFTLERRQEEKTSPLVESQQKDRCRKVHAVLVDPWARQTNFVQNQRPLSPSSSTPLPNQLQFVNPLDKCTNGHRNHVPYGKFMDVNDNSRVTFRTRKESDPIDRGDIPADALHGKIESLENVLDQIYRRMKTELRDVRDSLASLSPLPPSRTYSYSHGFGYQRTKDHADV